MISWSENGKRKEDEGVNQEKQLKKEKVFLVVFTIYNEKLLNFLEETKFDNFWSHLIKSDQIWTIINLTKNN